MSETPEAPAATNAAHHGAAPGLNEASAIVLAGVHRLAELQGFPVTEASLVAETDLDRPAIRDCLDSLAGTYLDIVEDDRGKAEVRGMVEPEARQAAQPNGPQQSSGS
jgi:hypothetical protein